MTVLLNFSFPLFITTLGYEGKHPYTVICTVPTSQHTHLTVSALIKGVLDVYKTRATGLNRINLSVQRLSVETGANSPFSPSDSYDVAGRVRDCALSSFVEPFARRNAVSSAVNGA